MSEWFLELTNKVIVGWFGSGHVFFLQGIFIDFEALKERNLTYLGHHVFPSSKKVKGNIPGLFPDAFMYFQELRSRI